MASQNAAKALPVRTSYISYWQGAGFPRTALLTSLLLVSLQMHMITERLCALENQVTAWRYKGVVFFTVLVSACALNLWQWLRH